MTGSFEDLLWLSIALVAIPGAIGLISIPIDRRHARRAREQSETGE